MLSWFELKTFYNLGAWSDLLIANHRMMKYSKIDGYRLRVFLPEHAFQSSHGYAATENVNNISDLYKVTYIGHW